MRDSAKEAWDSWHIDEEKLSLEPAEKRFRIFRHACLLDYAEKALLVYPHVRDTEAFNMAQVMEDLAKSGNAETMQALLDAGMDIKDHATAALLMAVEFKHGDIVRQALENGADPLVDDAKALKAAVQKDTIDILGFLLRHGQYECRQLYDAAFAAVAGGLDESLKLLVTNGFDVTWDDNRLLRETAAKTRSQTRMLSLLVEMGANIHCGAEDVLSAAVTNVMGENAAYLMLTHHADPLLMPYESFQKGFATTALANALTAGIRNARNKAGADFNNADYPFVLKSGNDRDRYQALYAAVRGEQLRAAIAAVTALHIDARKEYLSADDFFAPVNTAFNLLDVVIATEQYQCLFDPALWAGRADEMERLWAALPQSLQEKVTRQPFDELKNYDIAEKNQLLLKQKRGQASRPRFGFKP